MVRAGYVSILLLVPATAASCRCDAPPPAGTAASASAATSVSAAPASSSILGEQEDDEVKPVYPVTSDPPDPRAQRYCDLAHELPEKRRKECCPSTPVAVFRPTAECVRTLSYALRQGSVGLDDGKLAACETATRAEADKCDWGGVLPAACDGLFTGTVPQGQMCRSALECQRDMECRGLGATTAGRCMPRRPNGTRCGGVSDTLGAFTRQDAEIGHEECEGLCRRRSCVDAVQLGAACDPENACARGLRCAAGKCTDAPAPAANEPCPDGACHTGLVCRTGKCTAPKRLDETCTEDAECRTQFCDKAAGKCALKCGAVAKPSVSAK